MPVQLYDRDDFVDAFADAGPTLEDAGQTIAALLKEASRANVLGQIFAIREDVLGVYRFNPPTQPSWGDTDDANARIELFWGVIGLVSRLLGVSLEGLTMKVLAHELAHAYTHVGADADGRRWGTTAFQRTDRTLLEGLAQYYTCRVLERLGKQAPGAMDAYEKLLPHQPEIYRTHLGWLENHSPEEVREAMLTIRCRDAGRLAEFELLLGESKARRRNRLLARGHRMGTDWGPSVQVGRNRHLVPTVSGSTDPRVAFPRVSLEALKSASGHGAQRSFRRRAENRGHGQGTKWAQDGHKAKRRPFGAAHIQF